MKELPKAYNPVEVEGNIYKFWEESGYFNPDKQPNKRKGVKPYVITIPPPNVTGSLHMGHALNNTIQDILIRQKRMIGHPTLWVPGTDHAGIATQNVVEKMLKKQGKTRHDLGREEFIKKVWEWKEEYGGKIIGQLKTLGCSCDWSRERFTMDKDYSQAVNKAFEHYYKKGWIYRGTRVVNWCPRCQSTLSDLEVEYKEQKAPFYYFKYGPVVIGTARPETKFGDKVVIVHPKDPRYKKLVGKEFEVEWILGKIKAKVIADPSADMKLGTGAMTITPGHSLIDFELAQKYKIPVEKIIDEYGRMTKAAGKFEGLKVKETREKVVEILTKKGLVEKIDDSYVHNLSVCYRCGTPIEPLPSEQWFVKMKELVKPAIKTIKENKVKFYPLLWKKVSIDWFTNIRDWCISRQIWWGHRIPIKGETDVLDTWFSSALWPFATLGWPQKTKDLKNFYPTSTLVTDRGIIYLWVSRMIFSSLEFMDEIPFSQVYINPTVFNKDGRRMSKSLGTGVDPLELIEKYGTDATRFGLTFQDTGVQDIKFSEEAILAGKKFANKIFNASKFVIMNLENFNISQASSLPAAKTKEDRTILSQLDLTIKSVDENLEKFRFGQTVHTLYDFFWHDFCDKYLEESKIQLQDEDIKENTQYILLYILVTSLKLLHPFMPFITEEIWQKLKAKSCQLKADSIMISDWPHPREVK